MAHLEDADDSRRWHQTFIAIDDTKFSGAGFQYRSAECYAWVIQFSRNTWGGLLAYLEALPWPRPESVQVLVRDEEDDCFGLWMIYDGKLTEVPPSAHAAGTVSRLLRHRCVDQRGSARAILTSACTYVRLIPEALCALIFRPFALAGSVSAGNQHMVRSAGAGGLPAGR